MLPVFFISGIGNPAWVQNYLCTCTLSRKQHIQYFLVKSFITEILISISMLFV